MSRKFVANLDREPRSAAPGSRILPQPPSNTPIIASWNEFIGALIFMNKETMFTLPIMLVASRTGYYGSTDWGILQARVMISIIPCVPVYFLLQKYYVSGLMSGAVK